MNRKELMDIVMEIMIKYSGDGHTDGSDEVTDFIIALDRGEAEEWINDNLKIIK